MSTYEYPKRIFMCLYENRNSAFIYRKEKWLFYVYYFATHIIYWYLAVDGRMEAAFFDDCPIYL